MSELRIDCPGCGKPLIFLTEESGDTANCPYCKEPLSLLPPSEGGAETAQMSWWQEYTRSFSFPFRQPEWEARMGWLLLIAFIPFVNMIVLRGWRLNVVRRLAANHENPLPRFTALPQIFFDGVILVMVSFLYALPGVILAVVFGAGLLENALTILAWIYDTFFTDKETESLGILLTQVFSAVAIELLGTGVYLLLVWPVHRTAVVLYAVTGKLSSFLNFHAILKTFFQNARRIVLLLFYTLSTSFIILMLEGALAATWIGILAIPALMLLNFWVTACVYGRVAHRIAAQTDRQKK